MRHGQVWPRDRGRRFIGTTDLPLDRTGEAQAASWQPVLNDLPISRVYVSGLSRTGQTAARCRPDVPAVRDDRLNEINLGSWENQTFASIKSRFPEAFEARGLDIEGFRPPGGESFGDLYRRVSPFFDDLAGTRPPGLTLVVTHAGVIRVMRCAWEGVPLSSLFSFTPACGEILLYDLA